jgi:hypothetical protein
METEALEEQDFGDWEEDNKLESGALVPEEELDDTTKEVDEEIDEEADEEVDDELDTDLGTVMRDTEFQLMAALSFHSPALQILWAPEFVSRRERGLQRLEAGRVVFGQTYGRGTGRALGVWANGDNPWIWLLIWYWIRRQREILSRQLKDI